MSLPRLTLNSIAGRSVKVVEVMIVHSANQDTGETSAVHDFDRRIVMAPMMASDIGPHIAGDQRDPSVSAPVRKHAMP